MIIGRYKNTLGEEEFWGIGETVEKCLADIASICDESDLFENTTFYAAAEIKVERHIIYTTVKE